MNIRKWYFAINETGIPGYKRLIQAAVLSCKQNTSLQPVCLYYGHDVPFLLWLESQNVKIIRHQSSILDAINSTPSTSQWNNVTATGAYLRIDIPLIEQEDEFVLYTDCDVIFLKEITDFGEAPEYFSGAPEDDPENWEFANTGVMIINVKNMRKVHADFSAFAAQNLTRFAPKGHGTYDQGALNAYFSGKWSRLTLDLNWKPYWGISPTTRIVHFHGPKPSHIEDLITDNTRHLPNVYKGLFAKNPASMAYYLGRFHAIEQSRSANANGIRYLGYIDAIKTSNNEVTLSGWAVDLKGSPSPSFQVKIAGEEVDTISVLRKDRPDVSRSVAGAAIDSGYEITFRISEEILPEKIHVLPYNADEPLSFAKGFSLKRNN